MYFEINYPCWISNRKYKFEYLREKSCSIQILTLLSVLRNIFKTLHICLVSNAYGFIHLFLQVTFLILISFHVKTCSNLVYNTVYFLFLFGYSMYMFDIQLFVIVTKEEIQFTSLRWKVIWPLLQASFLISHRYLQY